MNDVQIVANSWQGQDRGKACHDFMARLWQGLPHFNCVFSVCYKLSWQGCGTICRVARACHVARLAMLVSAYKSMSYMIVANSWQGVYYVYPVVYAPG